MAILRGTVFEIPDLTTVTPVDTVVTLNGLVYISLNGVSASYACLSAPTNIESADPGTGNAIPVTGSTSISLTIGAGAETNTLADPGFAGQQLSLIAESVGGGARVITAASDLNVATNTILTFNAAREWALLVGINVGTIAAPDLRWRIDSIDGATPS